MRLSILLVYSLLLAVSSAASAAECDGCCNGTQEMAPECKVRGCVCEGRAGAHFHSAPHRSMRPAAAPPPSDVTDAAPNELTAARVYLRAKDIPPKTAAYGIVALRSRPTSASRDKLMRVCAAYKSFLPTNASLPASISNDAKMLTVWPLDDPEAAEAKADDCAFVLDHYDLYAGQSAIRDAASGGRALEGDGPYLIGWSPSQTRGVQDKLVLVVDLGGVDTQAGIDDRFKFWQKEIIEKPEQWKHGFSLEALRVSMRDFVDRYGTDLMSAVALVKPH